jgi:hypothetical protein
VRVECASCHQVVSPALAINSAEVGLTCPSCGEQITPAALAAAETDDELATTTPLPRIKELDDATAAVRLATTPPPMKDGTPAAAKGPECPKCGAALKAGAEACAGCGLATARMATFKSERDLAVPDEVRTAWDKVIAKWDDEARHDALFTLIAARGEYGWTAGRYREQARERAGDPVAPKQMDRIRRAIEATMVVSATARDKPQSSPYKNTATLLGVLIVVLVVGMAYMFIKSRSASSEEPPPPPPRSGPQVR